jgi:hypothetical protein
MYVIYPIQTNHINGIVYGLSTKFYRKLRFIIKYSQNWFEYVCALSTHQWFKKAFLHLPRDHYVDFTPSACYNVDYIIELYYLISFKRSYIHVLIILDQIIDETSNKSKIITIIRPETREYVFYIVNDLYINIIIYVLFKFDRFYFIAGDWNVYWETLGRYGHVTVRRKNVLRWQNN